MLTHGLSTLHSALGWKTNKTHDKSSRGATEDGDFSAGSGSKDSDGRPAMLKRGLLNVGMGPRRETPGFGARRTDVVVLPPR